MTLRNAFADLATEDTLAARNGGGKLASTTTVTTSGDTTLIASPGLGFALKLFWVSAITDPDSDVSPLIIIKWDGGSELYRVYAVAHWEIFTGPEDTALVINLSEDADVAVTIHYLTVPI